MFMLLDFLTTPDLVLLMYFA